MSDIRTHVEIIEEVPGDRMDGPFIIMRLCRVLVNGVDVGMLAEDGVIISTKSGDCCRVGIVLMPDSVTIRKAQGGMYPEGTPFYVGDEV